jgi:predicted RNA-binding protein (virulence factor B family)
MEINFSKNEFKNLLEMLFLADWVTNCFKERDDKTNQTYDELKQKIMALADDYGCGHMVEYNEDLGMFVETEEVEDCLLDNIIIPYEQNKFWLNLSTQLALRDYEEKYGSSSVDLQLEKTQKELDESEEEYLEEFSENGVKNLKIVEE